MLLRQGELGVVFFKVNRVTVCGVSPTGQTESKKERQRERERSIKQIGSPFPSLSLFLSPPLSLILSLTMLFLPRCERNND